MKSLEHYLEKSIKNIEDDREVTKELLDDVMRYLGKSEERHREVGQVAAKYVETLQRSNEQLVKISTLIQKENAVGVSLTEDDKAEIFDMLQSNGEA